MIWQWEQRNKVNRKKCVLGMCQALVNSRTHTWKYWQTITTFLLLRYLSWLSCQYKPTWQGPTSWSQGFRASIYAAATAQVMSNVFLLLTALRDDFSDFFTEKFFMPRFLARSSFSFCLRSFSNLFFSFSSSLILFFSALKVSVILTI